MAKTTYISELNGVKIYAERAQYTREGKDITSEISRLEQEITSTGSYEVVPQTSGDNPQPVVNEPKTTVIYLTKAEGSTKKDPYTEWIYIPASTKPAVAAHWEIIGETSIDLPGYKTKQTAVDDPTASGTGLSFIATASQDENGVISVTKTTVQDGTTSQKGVVQLQATIGADEDSDSTAATPKAVRDAIKDLDVTAVTVGASKTLASISETDGKISASAVDIQIAESQVTNLTTDLGTKADKVTGAPDGNFAGLDANGNLTDSGKTAADFANATHAHGSLTNDGKIGNAADYAVVTATDGAVTATSLATSSPSTHATDKTLEFIDTVSQDSKGKISATKKAIQTATTSQSGVVQLQATIGADEDSDSTAATPKAVRTAITSAVGALDATVASAGDTGVTPNFGLSVTEADGVITGVTVTSDNTEDKRNKVTSWTSTTTNTHYPSEKLVKDSLDNKADKVTGTITAGNFAGLDQYGNITDSDSKASDFKTVQTAVSDPSADGTGITFIDSISQDTNGVITPHKKTVQTASTSAYGVVTYATVELDEIPSGT